MNLFQMLGFAVVASLFAMLLKEQKPLFALLLVVFASSVLMLGVLKPFIELIQFIIKIAEQSRIDKSYIMIVVKMIGIAYLAEIGGQLIRDTGQDSLAQKIELAAKIYILYLAIPIANQVIQTVIALFPSS